MTTPSWPEQKASRAKRAAVVLLFSVCGWAVIFALVRACVG